MQTNFEDLEMYALTESEMSEINGGFHYEVIDGKLVVVPDKES